MSDTVFVANAKRIADLCNAYSFAAVSDSRPLVDAGILAAYRPDQSAIAMRAAAHVDKLLKGAKAGDLPVELPTQFELVVNMNTAKALRLSIAASLLGRADVLIR